VADTRDDAPASTLQAQPPHLVNAVKERFGGAVDRTETGTAE
jgi:hypothetical protein